MSVNLLLENEETPVVWRGPVIAGTVKQFWSDVVWGDVDYMFVDMPPGTGDVPLTVFQSLPVAGIIVVTSPQELVSMIVAKAVHMAEEMKIPVLGFVENYSYITCGHCGEKLSVFGESRIDEIAAQYMLPVLAKLPVDPAIAGAADSGRMEELSVGCLRTCLPQCMRRRRRRKFSGLRFRPMKTRISRGISGTVNRLCFMRSARAD